MPQACWYGESAQGRCAQIVAAEAGPYAVRVSAYDACTGPCVCDGDECLGGVGGAEAKSEPVTLKFPEQGEVEVVFEACAFGCPEETP